MVKNFKGVVKISEVKDEFDKLVKGLNSSVDEYNNIEEVQDIDYNKAGSTLAQLGYTLTIGGLKQFMQIYDGYCFGCRVFKTGNNQCKPTSGILVTRDKLYRIPTDLVNGYGSMLFYNLSTGKCQLGGAVKVTKDVTIPTATNNNTPWLTRATRDSGNAWKALSFNRSTTDGWNIGTYEGQNSAQVKILQYIGNDYAKAIPIEKFDVRLTASYPSELTIKAGTVMQYEIVSEKGHNLTSLVGALNSLSFNGAKNVYVSSANKPNADSDKFSYTYGTSADFKKNVFRYTFKKDIKFKSLTVCLALYYMPGQAGNQGMRTSLKMQNLKFYSPLKMTVVVNEGSESEQLIKIADLNWGKTTNDKLWLNDLPHSMY